MFLFTKTGKMNSEKYKNVKLVRCWCDVGPMYGMVWYVWYGMYGMVWYGMVWYVWYGMVCMVCMVWYGMVWYVWYGMYVCMVWYGMYGMVWYGMVWYVCMVWYGMVCMVWYGMYVCMLCMYGEGIDTTAAVSFLLNGKSLLWMNLSVIGLSLDLEFISDLYGERTRTFFGMVLFCTVEKTLH